MKDKFMKIIELIKNDKKATIEIILGIIIIAITISNLFLNDTYRIGLFVMIVVSFGLLVLTLTRNKNAWDVWFFNLPLAITTLFLIGVLASDSEVWKWLAIAIGGSIGLEALGSVLKKLSD